MVRVLGGAIANSHLHNVLLFWRTILAQGPSVAQSGRVELFDVSVIIPFMKTRTIDFSRYSSLRIGPKVDVAVIESKDFDAGGYTLIGGANNLLISPTPPPLAMLGSEVFGFCELESDCIRVGGALKTGQLASFCRRHDLGGLEFTGNLPGTVGGLVAMNAGMKAWETFAQLLWVDFGVGRVPAERIPHGYRRAELPGIVYEAGFVRQSGFERDLEAQFKAMRANQPKAPSAGSCFKNPPGDYAGRLIEAVGLKGLAQGGMAFSEEHANFLINTGGGTYEAAIALIDEAKKRVKERFGVVLNLEVQVL